MTPNADVAGVEGAVTLLTIELEDNTAWELLIELAESDGHPNIAKSLHKAKEQEDDHLLKIKSLIRRDLILQIK